MGTGKFDEIVSVIGLGYVGLPVAVGMSTKFPTLGFDVNLKRIEELRSGYDRTDQISKTELAESKIQFCDRLEMIKSATVHIVTVPTPIDDAHRPDLTALFKASEMVGSILKKGDMVIYESTVYPGLTEEECAPILERKSGLKCGVDFDLGYSPERINPGDKDHTFKHIRKVVSAQDEKALNRIGFLYGSVVEAGIFQAASIKVAESAKIIENIQRDLNIALINELSMIFHKMSIDTQDVLAAARTKWNFLPFQPGLVGGHCIGVDPYYLTHKAERMGFIPQVILAGRRTNNEMGKYIAQNTVREMVRAGCTILNSTVTILGMTFKEDCPDIRNSRVVDIVRELQTFGINVQVADPHADIEEMFHEYGLRLTPMIDLKPAEAIVVAVAHQEFRKLTLTDYKRMSVREPLLIDVKGILERHQSEDRASSTWRL
jgi:UDP-N-acetyl-D-glucosamine/UDP-N-acetyl-D-galactosamine dehydrogenase